ncbi:hypothetical protein AMTRI_Chr01g109590 [Amborella trichopoda]|uniref:BZIP domain-containing protein n=1 Tax=Amborella trichopoda TaxID=13333 RepID=W1PVM0_AMBTC|nr:basic leucine zipper 24 [Amborella trichopoda]ERN12133.1 hypothetical protein AMTR_s00159p00081760 [Amborella trichopoda]|eukprot:XP_020526664.1 basic leucine zipper 24 [Amborella trichopoda]
MDDGEVELSSEHVFLCNSDDYPMESMLDALMSKSKKKNMSEKNRITKDSSARTCTHTHTCNPPGPDSTHTHTCYHTHTTQLFSPNEEPSNSPSKPNKTSGNREAVRKYREKKKAHTAYLEEEVKKLRALNQQLLRTLQGQAMLEAEVVRLRTILMDLRGKIDGELGVSPFQRASTICGSGFKEGNCSLGSIHGVGEVGLNLVGCGDDVPPCLHPQGKVMENCEPPIISCQLANSDIASRAFSSAETQLDSLIPANEMGISGSLVASISQAE